MASIDRYRPPREGYQPPSLPRGSRHEQTPRSPSRRRDVPLPVPSPPQASQRTSPPRSNPLAGASSQIRPPLPLPSQWHFTFAEVQSTPTILDGINPAEERLRKAKAVNFIYQAGVMLDLPQITLWVAGVFFHRFFMRCSMVEEKGGVHQYNIAAAALFLANKVEENCRKTKDIIIAVAKVAQKNANLIIDEQSKEYWRWRDSILIHEEVMLEQLTFDLMIENPYKHLFELLGQLDVVHNKYLRHGAWAFCNDACLTALPLLLEAREVAIIAIFFASVHTSQQIDNINGEAWWKYLKGNDERCSKAIEVMRQFYTENPLRKQNPSLPSPAFDLESTRRRADTLLSQPDTISSRGGTPQEAERASHSPTGRSVGGTETGPDPSNRVTGLASQAGANGSDDHVSRTSSKRKDSEDPRLPDQLERREKRARLSEDEGEVAER